MKPLDQIIESYISFATGYAESVTAGNSKEGDRFFDKIEGAFVAIKCYDSNGLSRLATLMQHEDQGVRLWSSAHLLNYPEYQSEKVIIDIINSETILGLTAEITYEMWKSGSLEY